MTNYAQKPRIFTPPLKNTRTRKFLKTVGNRHRYEITHPLYSQEFKFTIEIPATYEELLEQATLTIINELLIEHQIRKTMQNIHRGTD